MNNPYHFQLNRLPQIIIGAGVISQLSDKILEYGQSILLLTGQSSFVNSVHWEALKKDFIKQGINYQHAIVSTEPSPQLVDNIVEQYYQSKIDCVVAIGGGSTLDTAKAVSGLLIHGDSVMDYLEGVGKGKNYHGDALPFIAVPTTAGTGSEATKNAVLSQIGRDGFKKSFRHDNLMPKYAIIDSDLLASCPKALIAANGMDALTQLIESYVSTKANIFTDALAISGIEAVRYSLMLWYQADETDNPELISQARSKMAYAALLSGITLAHVGLGSVHGLASPLGAFYPIPHGVACGTLLADACRINIEVMKKREPDNHNLEKYAQIGRILIKRSELNSEQAYSQMIKLLESWRDRMGINKLSAYTIKEQDIDKIVAHSRGNSMLTNPIVLTDQEIESLIRSRL